MPRLLDQVRDLLKTLHDSIRTEEAYLQWIRRFILFHGKRHPQEMGERAGGWGPTSDPSSPAIASHWRPKTDPSHPPRSADGPQPPAARLGMHAVGGRGGELSQVAASDAEEV